MSETRRLQTPMTVQIGAYTKRSVAELPAAQQTTRGGACKIPAKHRGLADFIFAWKYHGILDWFSMASTSEQQKFLVLLESFAKFGIVNKPQPTRRDLPSSRSFHSDVWERAGPHPVFARGPWQSYRLNDNNPQSKSATNLRRLAETVEGDTETMPRPFKMDTRRAQEFELLRGKRSDLDNFGSQFRITDSFPDDRRLQTTNTKAFGIPSQGSSLKFSHFKDVYYAGIFSKEVYPGLEAWMQTASQVELSQFSQLCVSLQAWKKVRMPLQSSYSQQYVPKQLAGDQGHVPTVDKFASSVPLGGRNFAHLSNTSSTNSPKKHEPNQQSRVDLVDTSSADINSMMRRSLSVKKQGPPVQMEDSDTAAQHTCRQSLFTTRSKSLSKLPTKEQVQEMLRQKLQRSPSPQLPRGAEERHASGTQNSLAKSMLAESSKRNMKSRDRLVHINEIFEQIDSLKSYRGSALS
eukprot:GILK01002906.1.p1 GENE.GILK01002906.1~~GILK01002906.1.p1  ORF type:complete len:473 (+),score=55.30 GILK01002906.1:33-1421(+)